MLRKDYERRLAGLERALDQFSGVDWIIQLGTLSEIKLAVRTMSAETEKACSTYQNALDLDEIDSWILAARNGTKVTRHHAFTVACAKFKRIIAPALPGYVVPGYIGPDI